MKLTLATAIKNEGPYLLEWISFYKALGFDDIVIFSNDNDDGSDELLHELQMAGYIQWRPRKLEPGESPQVTAFNALSKELLRTADGEVHYLAWFDCDEYLVLHRHTTVQEMIESYEHPDGLFINWKHFGSSGLTDFEDRLTIERFTRCSSTMSMNKFGKCITRVNPKLFSAIQHHRPIAKSLDNFGRIIYCSPDQGTPVSRNLISGKHPASDPEALLFHEVCQLNHYATRTPQEYAWKKQRGGGYTYQRQYRDDYFRMRDQNAEIDTRCAQRYGPLVNERVKEFPAHILACHANIIKMKTLETI